MEVKQQLVYFIEIDINLNKLDWITSVTITIDEINWCKNLKKLIKIRPESLTHIQHQPLHYIQGTPGNHYWKILLIEKNGRVSYSLKNISNLT